MATTMTLRHGSSLETRPSLLKRLQAGDDDRGWEEFYRLYGGLIRHFAVKAGLTPEEAEDVVQETAIGVARRLPEFVYDPKVCRFKTWLLNQTRWQIRKQFDLRAKPGGSGRSSPSMAGQISGNCTDPTEGTDALARIPDPATPDFGAEWDAEWEKHLMAQGLERVRDRIDERQFQIFDLYVTKDWPAGRVAKTLGISIARVYLTKHRVAAMLKKEVRRLEKQASSSVSEKG
jgi:RNA polymerase sigma-70 factor (ECF subfamily)